MKRFRKAFAPVLLAAALVGAMLVAAEPSSATLQLLTPVPETPATFVGNGGYSADGLGQTVAGGTVQADVPAGSTVVQAYLHGTYTSFSSSVPPEDLTIDFDGTNVPLSPLPVSGNPIFLTARADVTSQVAAKVGSGGAITNFAINNDPFTLDGVSLVVIYSNPASPDVTIALLDGTSNQAGDQVTLNFAAPLQTGTPGFSAVMSLGSGFSSQGNQPGHVCAGGQFSTVTVNSSPLTSCAGNFDDGESANGALITVGGVGDSIDNPADGTSSTTGTDDELYNLVPFLATGDTALVINTANPSNDDNLFLAVVAITAEAVVTTEICDDGIDNDGDELVDLDDPDCTPPTVFNLDLTPADATNPVNTQHNMTATLTNGATPVSGGSITFTVTGANETSATTSTNASGQATFSYTGVNPGEDTITACYENNDAEPCEALDTATKTWTPVDTGGPTVTGSSEPPTVTRGSNVQQTLTVTNTASTTLTNVSFTVTFPAGSTVLSATPGQGTCTGTGVTRTCTLGSLAPDANVATPFVVRVPTNFAPGVFAPSATVTSTQTGTDPAGPLPGSQVVVAGSGSAFGYVPPNGTLTTGDASAANPTTAAFTLPNTGAGAPIALTTEPTTPTYCGNQACRGRLLTLSPFGGGYDNPNKPPVLDISLDKSVVKKYGNSYNVWVQKEDPTVRPKLVPDCKSLGVKGRFWWHWKWWRWLKGQKIAVPSPCVSKRYIDRNGDSHTEILVLQGDPKFGRR